MIRPLCAVLTTALLVSTPCYAFQSPLSDESVREAYFLGQRHDDSLPRFLEKYTKALPPPKTGPYISSVSFLTPFVLVAKRSSEELQYSAQQAALDHRNEGEIVEVIIEVQLTASYASLITRPTGSRSDSPIGYAPRPYDFWKDFEVQVSADDKEPLRPFSSSGNPHFLCSDIGGCILMGAAMHFELLPGDFDSADSVTIQVFPPEGEPVSVTLDISRLR